MSSADVHRAITRMAHEVAERNRGLQHVVLIGLQTGGVAIAQRLAETLAEVEGAAIRVGTLDVAFYRDDIGLRPVLPEAATDISFDLTGTTVVLVDDVLFTGRTIRAALNALGEYGRAQAIELAVMVDRGHRELPIRPDYVGKNLPTRRDEMVDVSDDGVSLGDLVNR
jgi:pyrimidine operon attenuation protein/uracil phosphoribosyltransferase